jgi:transmembrane sensor
VFAFVGVAAVLTVGWLTVRPRLAGPVPAQVYVTAPGQQSIVTVAKGTQAVLAPGTKMTVSSTASAGTVVAVVGQVLFTIEHQTAAPFVVQAGAATARVLGTTFLVRRYPTESATRVVVVSGRVGIAPTLGTSHRGAAAVLDAGTLGVVDDSGRIDVTPHIVIEDYTAWTAGRLVFRQTPVRDIVAELSRTYGVDIQLVDSTLAKRAFTWTVPVARLTLDGALDALVSALDAHVSRKGSVIWIAPGSVTTAPTRAHPPYTPETHYGR